MVFLLIMAHLLMQVAPTLTTGNPIINNGSVTGYNVQKVLLQSVKRS